MQKETLLSLILTAFVSLGAYNYLDKESSNNNLRPYNILDQFQQWKIEHNKEFKDINEQIFRRKVFYENIEFIKKINSQQNSYTLKANKFAHLTDQEFSEIFLHQKEEILPELQQQQNILESQNKLQYDDSFTWKGKGVLFPPQDMGYCDASYAFSTVGVMEAQYVLGNRQNLTKFSEQQLLSCNNFGAGCKGGSVENSFDFYEHNNPISDQNYPYVSQNGFIPRCSAYPSIYGFGFYTTQQGKPPKGQRVRTLQNLIQQRPVSSGIDGSKLRFYNGGIFNDCGDNRNIDMLVIGYTRDYWELKAPFGTYWGDQGYLKIAMGETCGITIDFFSVL